MNIKSKYTLHNRFDIEVRDSVTNELKRTAYAENIVLNGAYAYIINMLNSWGESTVFTFFNYIHFGGGSGELSADRSTLFSAHGHALATLEERTIAPLLGKVVKKIQLDPNQYVGKTFTEVGIGSATSAIFTHAMIKDSEGNPLTLTKSNLDVLLIYSTLYITLESSSEIVWEDITSMNYIDGTINWGSIGNKLLNAILGYYNTGSYNKGHRFDQHYIALDSIAPISNVAAIAPHTYSLAVKTVDIPNKKFSVSKTFQIGEGNDEIRSICVLNLCRINVPNSSTLPYEILNKPIGVGNGTDTVFTIPWSAVADLVVMVNGVPTTDYVHTLAAPVYQLEVNSHIKHTSPLASLPTLALDIPKKLSTIRYGIPYTVYTSCSIRVYGSNDDITYVQIGSSSHYWTGSDIGIESPIYNINSNTAYKYFKMTAATGPSSDFTYLKGAKLVFQEDLQQDTITFNAPVASDSLITANYKTDYIPKDADHILDVKFDFIFGEGV